VRAPPNECTTHTRRDDAPIAVTASQDGFSKDNTAAVTDS